MKTKAKLKDTEDCKHLHLAKFFAPQPGQYRTGCVDCNEMGEHGNWVHLRMCMTDGKIRCCDSSPNQHASKHALFTMKNSHHHPLVRSVEPDEDWVYCYFEKAIVVPELSAMGLAL